MEDFIPTKCAALKKDCDKEFTVVKYESHKKNTNKRKKAEDETKVAPNAPELNMKRAKYEIIKFGMSGFDTQRKEEAKIQLAIKLGAKPPRNKYKNYRELIEEKKKEKQQQNMQASLQQLGKDQFGKSIVKTSTKNHKKKKEKGDILQSYGKVKKIK